MSEFKEVQEIDEDGEPHIITTRINDEGFKSVRRNKDQRLAWWDNSPGGSACRGEI